MFWVAFAVMLITMIAMACCTNVRRTSPMNFIFLFLFTLAQSFLLGVITTRAPAETVSFFAIYYFFYSIAHTNLNYEGPHRWHMCSSHLPISMSFSLSQVLLAVGITAAVCLGLTLFAFQTKWDFTVIGGVLFVAAIVLLLFGIVAMFFPGKTMQLVYASFGALLFSVYLIYEYVFNTQLIKIRFCFSSKNA